MATIKPSTIFTKKQFHRTIVYKFIAMIIYQLLKIFQIFSSNEICWTNNNSVNSGHLSDWKRRLRSAGNVLFECWPRGMPAQSTKIEYKPNINSFITVERNATIWVILNGIFVGHTNHLNHIAILELERSVRFS